MKTFRAYAYGKTYYYADIEAETEEEAWEIAENLLPYDEWKEDKERSYYSEDFKVTDVEED